LNATTRALAAFSLTLLATPAAFAQGAPPPPPDEADTSWVKSQGNRAGLEFDLLYTSSDLRFGDAAISLSVLGMAFTGVAQIEVVDKIYIDAALPFAYGSYSASVDDGGSGGVTINGGDDSLSGVTLGNPVVGAHYADTIPLDGGPELAFSAGGTVSIPTIFDPGKERTVAITANLPARAFYDLDRLAPETMAIRLRGAVEIRILPYLLYRGDFAPVSFIPLDSGDFELYVEQGNEIEARSEAGFGGGLRLQEVFPLTENDLIQTAIEPFFSYEPNEAGFYARVGFLMALDKQLGFAFDEGKVKTLRVALGGKW
jgi:hypothetical protein